MIVTDDKRSEYPSELADLRWMPLEDVPALTEGELGSALRRLVPDSSAGQVLVAKFNSAI